MSFLSLEVAQDAHLRLILAPLPHPTPKEREVFLPAMAKEQLKSIFMMLPCRT
jgi:hypothetical protein